MTATTAQRVTLTTAQQNIADFVGAWRHAQSVRDGRREHYDAGVADGLASNMTGAGAEYAVCLDMGVRWRFTVNTFHEPDIDPDWQVRSTTAHGGHLLTTPSDNPAHRYVLVIADPPHYVITGWLYGHEMRRADWWRPRARIPSWWAPQDALRDWADR